MYLPTFPRRMAAVRHVQTDFRGYDHRPGCPEGGIYEMTNGSAADAPLFSTRPGRTPTPGVDAMSPGAIFPAREGAAAPAVKAARPRASSAGRPRRASRPG